MGKFFNSLYIRLVLFRIWLFKNILIFVYIGIIVIVALILAGVIPESVPVLGQFASLFRFEDSSTSAVCTSLLTITSILISVYIICTRIKKICLSDIKSRKIKVMMASAGLKFNDNGKIVKSNTIKSSDKSIPVVDTAQELLAIVTADIDKTKAQDIDNGADAVMEQIENEDKTTESIIETDSKIKRGHKLITGVKNYFNKFKTRINNHKLSKKEKADELNKTLMETADRLNDAAETVAENNNNDEFTVVKDDKISENKSEETVDKLIPETSDKIEASTEQEANKLDNSAPKTDNKTTANNTTKPTHKSNQQSAFDAFKSSM